MFGKKDRTQGTLPPPSKAPATGSGPGVAPGAVARRAVTAPGGTGAKTGLAAGSAGKQAYEARRAEKAGMALEKWMAEKDRRVQAEREAVQRARQKAEPRKPGLLRRLLDRAHRPI